MFSIVHNVHPKYLDYHDHHLALDTLDEVEWRKTVACAPVAAILYCMNPSERLFPSPASALAPRPL
jgi:hypothetical protein